MAERDIFINRYLNTESDIYHELREFIDDIDVVYRWDNFDIAQTFDNTKYLICYKISDINDDILDAESLEDFIKEMYDLKFRHAVIITNCKYLDKNIADVIHSRINYNIHIDVRIIDSPLPNLTGIYKILFILCAIVFVYAGITFVM